MAGGFKNFRVTLPSSVYKKNDGGKRKGVLHGFGVN